LAKANGNIIAVSFNCWFAVAEIILLSALADGSRVQKMAGFSHIYTNPFVKLNVVVG